MQTIGLLSQKGGVGKSTLSRLLAVAYAKAGWSVKIADFNLKQKTAANWVAVRLKEGHKPDVSAEAFSSVRAALLQEKLFDLIVFDGRPDSDVTSLEIAKVVDLVVIPVGTGVDDLEPQLAFARELRSKGVSISKLRFVVNTSSNSRIAIYEAKTLIERAGFQVLDSVLVKMTSCENAQNFGKSIAETDYDTINERADDVAEEIAGALDEARPTPRVLKLLTKG